MISLFPLPLKLDIANGMYFFIIRESIIILILQFTIVYLYIIVIKKGGGSSSWEWAQARAVLAFRAKIMEVLAC